MRNLLRFVSGIMLGLGLSLLILPAQMDYVGSFGIGFIPITTELKICLALLGGLVLTLFAIGVLVRRMVECRLTNE